MWRDTMGLLPCPGVISAAMSLWGDGVGEVTVRPEGGLPGSPSLKESPPKLPQLTAVKQGLGRPIGQVGP